MRRGLLLVPLVAVSFLTGCHQYWGGSYGSGGTSPEAEAAVRASIPAIEAWHADHDTYAGMTLEGLQQQYDAALKDIAFVGPLNGETYCVESTLASPSYFKAGPGANIQEGHCGDPVAPPPPPPLATSDQDAGMTIRAAIPSIEAYGADHGTYRGMTATELRAKYDFAVSPQLEVVRATKTRYCIQATVGDETYSFRGPHGPLARGGC
jgi:hypothetical protein